MFLTLEVISSNAASLGANARKVFGERGGTIGRRPDRDWVINDQGVSSRHAVIRSINGFFFIEDEGSTNGVRVNENLLPVGDPYPLKDGDRIGLDLFDIAVKVTSAASEDRSFEGPVKPAAGDAFPSPPPVPGNGDPFQVAAPGASDVDPLDLLGGTPRQTPTFPSVDSLEHGSPIRDHFAPPIVEPPPAVFPPPASPSSDPPAAASRGPSIAADWDKTVLPARAPPAGASSSTAAPRPQPGSASRTSRETPPTAALRTTGQAPERRATSRPAASSLQGILAGAGIDVQVLTPEVEATLGQVLRVVVEGLMEVLRARTEIKNEFRLQQTSFKPRENNPLKFSANVEDALHNLLVKRNPAYLPAAEAFQDAFEDVRLHQVAMLAGVREAFDAMLQEFDPEKLEQAFDGGSRRSGLLGMGGRNKNWELYTRRYLELTRDADDAFRRLFGEEFGRAYEKQLERLKAARSGNR